MTDYSKLPDRELDALVAERVMGWTRVERVGMNYLGESVFKGSPPDKPHTHQSVPEYSTDANDALEVLEKAAGEYPELTIRRHDPFDSGKKLWTAILYLGKGRTAMKQGENLPRIICESILTALAATEPE